MIKENFFAKYIPIIKAITDETNMDRRMNEICFNEISFNISLTAFAAPVLDFPIEYIRIKLRPITIVFNEPVKKRKLFLECFIISELISAAYPDPIAGRNAKIGEVIKELKIENFISFNGTIIFFKGTIFCFFIFSLLPILVIIEDAPNNPVRRGRRGSFTGKFKVANPRNPARMKTTIAEIAFFSLSVMYKETKIKMNGINMNTFDSIPAEK